MSTWADRRNFHVDYENVGNIADGHALARHASRMIPGRSFNRKGLASRGEASFRPPE